MTKESKFFKTRKITHKKLHESLTDRQERIPGWRQDRMKLGHALNSWCGCLRKRGH